VARLAQLAPSTCDGRIEYELGARMTVRFGSPQIPDPMAQLEATTQVARIAQQEGLDSLWVFDHFQSVPDECSRMSLVEPRPAAGYFVILFRSTCVALQFADQADVAERCGWRRFGPSRRSSARQRTSLSSSGPSSTRAWTTSF
jgi:hypothetical protein